MLEHEWWLYFLIPWIAGFVGYFTNVWALFFTFYPLEFWGPLVYRIPGEPWGFFGWQGIIPTRARKMASVCFDLFTEKLFSIQEIFSRLDPDEFGAVMEDHVLLLMDQILDTVATRHMPTVWKSLSPDVRDGIVVAADSDNQTFLAAVLRDMQEHVDDIVDIKHMAVTACVANKGLIVKIFQECGEKEFTFIRQSGFYFGFAFGLIQMIVFMFFDAWWIMPLAGFIVGWLTNYLALKVIFAPLEPRNLCGVTIHGIFLKRQNEVSEVFARVVMTEILNVRAIWEAIFKGPLHNNFNAMLRAHTIQYVDSFVAEIQPLAVAALGADVFLQVKEDIANQVVKGLPKIIDNSYEYTQKALNMEETVRERMQKLSYAEFEGVLHPAFQEDEIQLILLGGLLGAFVGCLQVMVLF